MKPSSLLLASFGKKLIEEKDQTVALHSAAEAVAGLRTVLGPRLGEDTGRTIELVSPRGSIFEQCYFAGGARKPLAIELDTRGYFGSLFRDVTVVYNGGPTILMQTEFVNCRFDFAQSPEALRLLRMLMDHNMPEFLSTPDAVVSSRELIDRWSRR